MATIMKLRLIVERDPETGRYSSVFPELPVVLQRVTLRWSHCERQRSAWALVWTNRDIVRRISQTCWSHSL